MEDVFLARQKIGNSSNVCFALDEMGQFWSLIERDPTMDNVMLSLYTAKVTARLNQPTLTITFIQPLRTNLRSCGLTEVKSPKIQFISFTQVLSLKLVDASFLTLINTCPNLFICTQPDTMLLKMSSWGPDTAGRLARYFEPIIKLFFILR